jgi:imidazoleglycerol phosphate synthase glutamine amidotransferase subunit HisH
MATNTTIVSSDAIPLPNGTTCAFIDAVLESAQEALRHVVFESAPLKSPQQPKEVGENMVPGCGNIAPVRNCVDHTEEERDNT